MKYLAFDIEAANCYQGNGKICSLGYVLADENFSIIEQKDIIINPNDKFHLKGRKGTDDLVLAYPKEVFYSAPKFDVFYDRIKALLEDKDTLVIGHAVSNDVMHLNSETKRYRLESFRFKYYDTQLMYLEHTGGQNPLNLQKIADELGIEFEPHRSDSDAYATMMVFRSIMSDNGNSFRTVKDKYGMVAGRIFDYRIIPCLSRSLTDKREKDYEEFLKFIGEVDAVWHTSPVFRGKVVCFNDALEKASVKLTKNMVQELVNRKGKYTVDYRECNIFVRSHGISCERTRGIATRIASGDKVKVMDEREFYSKIGVHGREDLKRLKRRKYRSLTEVSGAESDADIYVTENIDDTQR